MRIYKCIRDELEKAKRATYIDRALLDLLLMTLVLALTTGIYVAYVLVTLEVWAPNL